MDICIFCTLLMITFCHNTYQIDSCVFISQNVGLTFTQHHIDLTPLKRLDGFIDMRFQSS